MAGLRFLDAQLEALTPRDRKLLVGLVLFVSIVFCTTLWWAARGLINDKFARVTTARDNIELLEAIATEVTDADARVARGTTRIEQYKGQALSAYIEKVATDVGVKEQLVGVNEQGKGEVVGAFRQSHFRVDLKRVPLQGALTFVHELETAGYPLNIELARFKTTMEGQTKVIDLTLEILSFEAVEAG